MSELGKDTASSIGQHLSFQAVALACSTIGISATALPVEAEAEQWEFDEEDDASIESASVEDAESVDSDSVQSVMSVNIDDVLLENLPPSNPDLVSQHQSEAVEPLEIIFGENWVDVALKGKVKEFK